MNHSQIAWRVVVVAVAAASCSAIHVCAQDRVRTEQSAPEFPRVFVQIVEVKPNSAADFSAIVRNQMIPALKKSGVPWMQTWAPFLGANFTYVLVMPISDFTQFDGPDLVERTLGASYGTYRAALERTLTSTRASVETMRRDASIESGDSRLPNFATVQTFDVLPGRTAEFLQLMTADFLPVYKTGGQRDLWVYVMNFGGPAGQVRVVRPFANANEMAGRYSLNSAGLSQQALAALNARRNALFSREYVEIMHPIRELSYATGVQ